MWKPKFLSCGEDVAIRPKQICSRSETGGREKEPEPVARFNFSNLKPCFLQVQGELFNVPVVIVLQRFLNLFETALPGESFEWEDICKDPFSLYKLLDVSHIPERVYGELAQWIQLLMEAEELCEFVLWSFKYILDDSGPHPLPGVKRFQNVSIFLALAMILRTTPHVLVMKSHLLMKQQLHYNGRHILATPLTVWMTHQVSRTSFHVGLHSWVLNLLPLLSHCDPPSTTHTESTTLILQLAEKLMADPSAHTTVTSPFFRGYQLIPPPSLEPLLKFRFLATPASGEVRVEKIYTWFKDVALKGAPDTDEIMQQIFTVSLGLVGEENPGLAEEAAAIAIWSLTQNDACWEHWNSVCLYEQNLEASVDLLKKLVENWNDQCLEPSSASRKAMKHQFIQQIFTVSLRLAGKGNSVLAKEAAAIAIWSLTENIDCWKRWDNLYKENIEASVALLKDLVEKWNDPSLKLLSSPSDTLTLSRTMKSFRLQNKKNNDFLYKEADKSCKVISRRLSRGISSLKCAAIFAAVTAVFWMNLQDSVFQNPTMFQWVLLVTGIACGFLYFGFVLYFKHKKVFPL